MSKGNTIKISKVLSKNDTGETGGHQAGILVPKKPELLNFFPELNKVVKNPRLTISFFDEFNICWLFNYIYYNNKYFGGTRDEYRLTCMTPYIKQYDLTEGDIVNFSLNKDVYYVSHNKKDNHIKKPDDGTIKLSNKWRIIKLRY